MDNTLNDEAVAHTIANPVEVDEDKKAIEKFLFSYIIPDSKLPALEAHLKELSRKYPAMKTARKLRKAAEYFRFKKIIPYLKQQSSSNECRVSALPPDKDILCNP